MSRDDDSAAKMQMVIISAGEGSPTRDEGKIQGGQVLRGGYHHHHQQQQTQNQIRCLTVRELEEGWEDVIGKRVSFLPTYAEHNILDVRKGANIVLLVGHPSGLGVE